MSDLLKHVKVISQKTEVNPYLLAGLTTKPHVYFAIEHHTFVVYFAIKHHIIEVSQKNQQSPITAETNGHHDLN